MLNDCWLNVPFDWCVMLSTLHHIGSTFMSSLFVTDLSYCLRCCGRTCWSWWSRNSIQRHVALCVGIWHIWPARREKIAMKIMISSMTNKVYSHIQVISLKVKLGIYFVSQAYLLISFMDLCHSHSLSVCLYMCSISRSWSNSVTTPLSSQEWLCNWQVTYFIWGRPDLFFWYSHLFAISLLV